jgi:hypothetical protein
VRFCQNIFNLPALNQRDGASNAMSDCFRSHSEPVTASSMKAFPPCHGGSFDDDGARRGEHAADAPADRDLGGNAAHLAHALSQLVRAETVLGNQPVD